MKGVILAAGKGTRMREITKTIPKPLLPLLNKPILENNLSGLKESGVKEVLIVVCHLKEKIIDFFGDGKKSGLRIHYIEQTEMLGTGQAAGLVKDFVNGDDFLLMFGDIATPSRNILGIIHKYRKQQPFMMLTVHHVTDPSGAAVYVHNGVVQRIIEKPLAGTSSTNYDNAGIFIFRDSIFDLLAKLTISPRGEYELTDAIQMAINMKQSVGAYELQGFWSNVSSPEDLLSANSLALNDIGRKSLVDPSATLGRDYRIGDNVCIGAGVHLEEGVVIQNAVIDHNARIGRNTAIEYAYIGMGKVVEPDMKVTGKPDSLAYI